MTDWLVESNLGANFQLGMEAEFNALGDDGAVVRVKNQDLNQRRNQSTFRCR